MIQTSQKSHINKAILNDKHGISEVMIQVLTIIKTPMRKFMINKSIFIRLAEVKLEAQH
jgi:hypothetical protein